MELATKQSSWFGVSMPTKGEIDLQPLIDAAWKVRQNSYSPYSKFKVGSAILSASGKVYSGCNVENASYGGTICAERNAICQAIATEGPGLKLKHCIVATEADFPT